MVRSDMDMPIGTFAGSGSRIGARQDSDKYRHASAPWDAQLCSGVFFLKVRAWRVGYRS